ncbi:unnamed protein product [Caenorhabditis angaria]|uniref:Uncharacterized protein n=1 Tax=Caenorhabditis angaria TaxID=860376 RepID=A0A9P1IWF4_9PELO|nr:unnamed protein product [Caenorhabditis angaria]
MSSSSYKCRRFKNKVAIVTAGTKGIGLAIAERLGLEGASIVIGSRNQKNVDEAVAQLKTKGVKNVAGLAGDIGEEVEQKRLVDFTLQTFGKINILVNNHGINLSIGNILEVSHEEWNKLFNFNVISGFQMTKLVQPHIKNQGGGAIIFNASYSAYFSPPAFAAYAVTKTALVGLTRALAIGLAKDNIRVNGIAPGVVKTEMSRPLWEAGPEAERQIAELTGIALGRLGEPDDCAGAVAFLASDDANYVVGETMIIGGGAQARF